MFAALIALLPIVSATTYPLVESWKGDTFLNGFNYDASTYDNTTNGDVFWATSQNTSLIYTSSSDTVILKVDNTSNVVWNDKRYAPKLLTKKAYSIGTVWVIDALHVPYGCSVWPSIWTRADWPLQGEIDIFEGVNQVTTNQVALHAANTSCTADSSASFTGNLTSTQCAYNVDSNTGCVTVDESTSSYGEGFASAGGGVFIAELAEGGISVWFLTRSDVPSNMTSSSDSIDTSSLGTPVAYYPSSSCNTETFFGPQTLTIDITLCGSWAGTASVLEATCPTLATDQTCYTTYVVGNGSTYDTAYFELNYINIFSSSSGTSSETPESSNTVTASGSASSTSSSQSTSGAGRVIERWYASATVAVILLLALKTL